MPIKTKLPLQFNIDSLTIMIGRFGFVLLANRKAEKRACKQTN